MPTISKFPYNAVIADVADQVSIRTPRSWPRGITIALSGLWYLTAIPSEAVHALTYRFIRWPFDALGGLVYGRMSIEEIRRNISVDGFSQTYLSPGAFIIVSLVFFVTSSWLYRTKKLVTKRRLILGFMRLVGLGFAIALVVTCANPDIETAGTRIPQWLVLSVLLLPFWFQTTA